MNFPKPSLPSIERSSRPVPAVGPAAAVVPARNGGTAANGSQTAVGSDLAPPPPGFQQVRRREFVTSGYLMCSLSCEYTSIKRLGPSFGLVELNLKLLTFKTSIF